MGAGASFGSGECKPYPPPLGYELFSELQKTGGIFATIEEPLSSIFKDFEAGMYQFRLTRNADVACFLREMSSYFTKFSPGPNNFYRQLISILKKTKRKTVFVTANYEMLIELAAMEEGYNTSYVGEPISNASINILKIHGSCNFLPDSSISFSNIKFEMPVNSNLSILNAGVRPVSPREALKYCEKETSLAPAIALYAKGKQVLVCPGFVDSQQKAWLTQAEKAKRIFIIGLSVNPEDAHIWDALESSKASLYYVGRDTEIFLKWKSDKGRKGAYAIAKTFEEAIPKIERHLSSF